MMAERAGSATSERDVLLATKLYLPHPPPGFVPRPRLVDMLDDARAGGLVLVCAPAGFGKTALLGDWAQRGERAVAWLSLDAGDSDPARFWRHVVAAVDRARPGIAERVAPLLGPPAPPSFDALVTALINELATAPADGDLLLVLDDYHLVDSAPVHASLTFLLEHPPPGLRLVVASRADPPLPLARLRARGQLAELRAAQLRFTSGEAAALLREAAGTDLPNDALGALEARTEGWAAGLQLAALSLRGQADVAGFVATFSGSHRYVLDYLTEEVLERQPEQVRSFLLETSVLERLSGPLCDAVTGRSDGQAMLEAIEAAGLFLVPMDEVRGWWRYHHLFADLLRIGLQQQHPERVPVLHRAAAAWHDAHGLADEAVQHALAADDPTWAAQLMERHADALLLRSEDATVQRWVAALPASLVRSRPRLPLVQAWMALISRRVEAADTALDAAERAWKANPAAADEPFEPAVGRAASQLANIPAAIALGRTYLAVLHGDADRAIAFGRRALAGLGEGERLMRSLIQAYLGLAQWLGGDLAVAEDALSSFIAQGRAVGEPTLVGWGCHDLGQVQRAQGRLDAALGTYQELSKVGAAPGRPTLHAAGIAHVGMAEVAYQRDDLELALHHVSEAIAACRPFKYTQPLANGLATLAWIRQAEGDPGGAREAMEEASRAAPGPNVTILFNPVPAQRARLQLAQGEVAAVARWTEERGLHEDDEPGHPREREYLVLARLLAQDRPTQALALLGRLHAAATAQGRVGSVIEIRALQALALAACGEDAAAVGALAEALALGHPQGYVRVFADEGAPMRALLGRLITAQRSEQIPAHEVPLDYLARLLRAFDGQRSEPGQVASAAVPGLVEALTARELEVLGLLAAGRSNARIADELVITLDTVKKHVGRILDKLGAANRTEAVTRARRLGLLG